MKPCIECGVESVPEQVIDGVQVYECKNKHRWGIMPGADENKVREEILSNQVLLKVA